MCRLSTRACFALMVLCMAFRAAAAAQHTKTPIATIKKELAQKKAVLVDVREKSEWNRGHIDGAVLLPLSDLEEGIDAHKLARLLPKDKIIYAHCASGVRCLKAADILKKDGYEVRPLKPGYKALLRLGFPPAKK